MMYEWAGNGAGRCFFRTTTTSGNYESTHRYELDNIREAAIRSGCSFHDVGHITSEFGPLLFIHPGPPSQEGGKFSEGIERSGVYWDMVHFFPWVYEELNNVMFNVLCNHKGGKELA
jgi:hypothetical protein